VEALRKYPRLEDMTRNNMGLLAALEPRKESSEITAAETPAKI
jgi:hypothetical protein